ncbi:cytochrome b5-like heme/steroid binding domain-containing protein, partial [Hyaloraphidium curvatum]
MDEVATHNSPADCWFVVDGRVYDASAWIPSHPGGRAILAAYAGKDVSREWAELGHSEEATAIRDALLIG